MPAAWRLLLDGAGCGPWNMGVDEALLASAASGGPPTLRLYEWSGAWLSLGYAQRLSPARRDACARAGVGVVRRATGGAAVLHGADLTYAVAAPAAALPSGLAAAHGLISQALQAALATLGLAVEQHGGSPADGRPYDCFAVPARAELCVADRKLVGSAQRRVDGGVLQHGSLRLAPDPPAARCASGLSGDGATSLRELGRPVQPAALCRALAEAFAQVLGVHFETADLAPHERQRAHGRGDAPPASVRRAA